MQSYREGQEDQLAALGLVVNAVVLWDTRYLGANVDDLRARGFPPTTPTSPDSPRSGTPTSTAWAATPSMAAPQLTTPSAEERPPPSAELHSSLTAVSLTAVSLTAVEIVDRRSLLDGQIDPPPAPQMLTDAGFDGVEVHAVPDDPMNSV